MAMEGIVFTKTSDSSKPSDSFDRYLQYTDEKDLVAGAIREILSNDNVSPLERSLLDIGSHKAELVLKISGLFSEIVLVEQKHSAVDYLFEHRNDFNGQKVRIHPRTFESGVEQGIIRGEYDVVLASHILYYFKDLRKTIGELVKLTKPEGYLFVVYFAGKNNQGKESGFAEMVRQFTEPVTGKAKLVPPYRSVVRLLKENNQKPAVKIIRATVTIPNLEEALNLCDFYFDVPRSKVKPEVLEDLAGFFRQKQDERGMVILTYDHAFIYCRIKKS